MLGSHAVLPRVIHFQHLILYAEIHILHKEHLGEEARRGFEHGLLTKHRSRVTLLTRVKLKQKHEGGRNVTTVGNRHWQLMPLLRVGVSGTILGSCPRTGTISASALQTAGCGQWNCCLKIKSGHYHPFPLFLCRITVISEGIFNNLSLACAPKVSLMFSRCFQNSCLFLSVCSPHPRPKDLIPGCELLESRISPLTAIKSKKDQSWWTLAYFSNWGEWDERDSWLLWPLQDNCVSCVAWIKGCAIAAKMRIDTILLFNNVRWCVSSKYINSCHPSFLLCSPPTYFIHLHDATWWAKKIDAYNCWDSCSDLFFINASVIIISLLILFPSLPVQEQSQQNTWAGSSMCCSIGTCRRNTLT